MTADAYHLAVEAGAAEGSDQGPLRDRLRHHRRRAVARVGSKGWPRSRLVGRSLHFVPQPIKHDEQVMLDAARQLALSGGPAAVTARAVSDLTGAPSGSIYHRFPHRDDLVSAAWIRALERFLASLLPRLEPATAPAAADAAAHVVSWSRTNAQDAAMLARFSLRDLLRGDVSAPLAAKAKALQAPLAPALRAVAAGTGAGLDDVYMAVVDLPNGAVRRLLTDGGRPAMKDANAVRRAALLILERSPTRR